MAFGLVGYLEVEKMSALNAKISFFKTIHETKNPLNEGTFFQIVTSKKLIHQYGTLIEQIRTTKNEDDRKALKETLPAFTPSGLFSEHTKKGLIKHSGLLSFDLDAGNANAFLNADTVEAVKAQICKLPEVAFCQISASGTGLWGVMPMAHPERHEEQFEALKAAFAKKGFTIDKACKDVSRFRFFSYDPDPYINHNALPFTGLPKQVSEPPRSFFSRGYTAGPPPDDLPAQAAAYLVQNRVPLECTYDNFMRIAFACKYAWGAAGKETALDILHACTTFAQSNTARKFDTLWRNIRRENGTTTTAGTLVHMAKSHGFKYATIGTQLPTWKPNFTASAPMPAPRVEPPREQEPQAFRPAQEARTAAPQPAQAAPSQSAHEHRAAAPPMPQPPTAPQPVAPGIPSGWQLFEGQSRTGDTVRTWLDADGLPAAWSSENAPALAGLATDAAPRPYQNEIDLLAGYGFMFTGQDKYNPAKDDGLLDRCLARMERHRAAQAARAG